MSIGSTPLAKQPSNQASDYASSPVKTKTVTGKVGHSTKTGLKEKQSFSVILVTLYHRHCKHWQAVPPSKVFVQWQKNKIPCLILFLWNGCTLLCCYITHNVSWHLCEPASQRTPHIQSCPPLFSSLLLLLRAVNAQNRWVAWLHEAFLYATFPLSSSRLFRGGTRVWGKNRLGVVTHSLTNTQMHIC